MSKRVWVIPICCFLLFCPIVQAQQPEEDLQKEIEELKKGQAEIRKELADIKRLLQNQARQRPSQPALPDVKGKVFDVGENPFKGEKDARLTLIEFTDYQ